MSAPSLWQLSGVQFRRGPNPWPAEPLTLSIPAGRTAVLGLSGAGKTSLLDGLVGFTRPACGTVNAPTSLAWAPQNHGLWAGHRVREHLTLAGASESEADTWLGEFDLRSIQHARADTLSLGEGARLAVARALAQKAGVIVMDEPLAHVDSARAAGYWSAIRTALDRAGTSLLIATHHPEVALAEATHAICLEEGRITYQGALHDLYERPPTPSLAALLGPCNWLDSAEAEQWLGYSAASPIAIRPERLHLERTSGDACSVVASRFLGSHAETTLRHPSGVTRTFLHRPASALPTDAQVCLISAPRA